MKKTTLFNLFFCFCAFYGFAQTMVDDFESGAGGLVSNAGGITTAVVANPDPSGINTTANCMEVKRTGAQWWIIGGVNVTPDLAISDTETKYVSMMVYYPAQPDLAIRFDAPDDNSNGTGTVRALNAYTTPNQWQEIVFEIKDNDTGSTSFTHGTLFRLSIHPDMGFENVPAGQVLDTGGTIAGYIDQIQILDSNPLSNDEFKLENDISIYQNPSLSSFRVETRNNIKISDVSLYDMLGSKVKNISKVDTNAYDMSDLSSGLYIVKIIDERGLSVSKKLLKQ
ncbi:T9SS type A sorting domain-containing protein [Hyunsoonleella flava]|uniref:T9SS type A sorting domain-containing protein n=1 Tax=Hyunsoonleella flava TaxID=2527939 RepID=A0A4Q9FIA3_9FLAO|nr:T9SS type A sorting domain-containing protein [Hyunsoonleella flava]TBN06848.1 T9SS type A sorting domain-containing protein [Hyunsoonleella flava]